MSEQVIISISREYGSGGHNIAEIIAKHYNLDLYDRNILDEVAKEKGYDVDALREYEGKAPKLFLSRSVKGMNNSPEDAVNQMQFEFLKAKAKAGESFVIVGRCADYILKDYDCVIAVYAHANLDSRIQRIMKRQNVNAEDAEKLIKQIDRIRRKYHDTYSDLKWGDFRAYEMCINTSYIGVEKTAEVLIDYIDSRLK